MVFGYLQVVWLALAVVALAAGVFVYVRRRAMTAPVRPAAAPPARPATRMDSLLAELINVQNAEMRSVELGKWALHKLRTRVGTADIENCDDMVGRIDYDDIASQIPGINSVARAETARILEQIMWHVAAQCKNRPMQARRVKELFDMYERSAFHPSLGVLLGMNGYSALSPRPLPY